MEVFIRDEETKWDISYSLADSNNSLDCKDHKPIIVKSLDQHDAEIKTPLEEEIERLKQYVIDINKDNNRLREQLNVTVKDHFDPTTWEKQARQKVIAELEKEKQTAVKEFAEELIKMLNKYSRKRIIKICDNVLENNINLILRKRGIE